MLGEPKGIGSLSAQGRGHDTATHVYYVCLRFCAEDSVSFSRTNQHSSACMIFPMIFPALNKFVWVFFSASCRLIVSTNF